ncbi:hypothetical protein NWF32_16705 [Pseudomonas qingdaonensis]|nr:hypothetical protein [Pseudomonas qingdaonensis]
MPSEKAHDLLSSTRQSASVQQLAQAQGSRIKGLNKEVSVMKYTIMSFTALIGVLIVVFAFKGTESVAGSAVVSQAVAAPASPATLQGATCDNPLDWRQAADHIGQSAAVLGPIMKVTYKPSSGASRPGSTWVPASPASDGWGWWYGASIARRSPRCWRSRWRGARCA